MPTIFDRVRKGWNAFMNKDPTDFKINYSTSISSSRPDRIRLTRGNERTIITAVFNRIAVDISALSIEHVQLDENNRFLEVIDSSLNECFSTEANLDQTGRAFIQDVVMSLLDEGAVAIVPTDTNIDPITNTAYDILELRVGKILEWRPKEVKVRVYNENNGKYEDIICLKRNVAIIENPFYAVMNEPNSTLQRLIRKLTLMDVVDEQTGSGKLDLLVQLPYTLKSPIRINQAEERLRKIEDQLSGSKYGIAYIDATEHVTQLNRSIENQYLSQIEFLTNLLFSQLGITQSVLDGSADEQTLINYHNQTLEPIVMAIVDEMKRKFLTKNARTRRQSISVFKDPFRLTPISNIVNMTDTFIRNEVATANEMRQFIGMKPANDPKADELNNPNMPNSEASPEIQNEGEMTEDMSGEEEGTESQDIETRKQEYLDKLNALDEADLQLDQLESGIESGQAPNIQPVDAQNSDIMEYINQLKQFDDLDKQLDDVEKQIGGGNSG